MAREVSPRKTDSVFDFLYVDHRRVGLFLSQFSEFGDLTDIVHSTSVSEDATLSGGLKGIIGAESKTADKEGIERRYRAQWSQALNFLDEINARSMVNKDISASQLGRLVLSAGTLSVASMQPFQKTWGAVAQNQTAPQGNRHMRRNSRIQNNEPAEENSSAGLNILGSLEQPVFMLLKGDNAKLWSTLNPDFLIGGSADLNLKQGIRLTGKWHVLGILDCEPGPLGTDDQDRLCGGGDNIMSDQVKNIWHEFGLIFGRPSDCYGITPIIIMREIG